MAITIVKPEDLKDYIGKDLGTSEWFKVDQDRINTHWGSGQEQLVESDGYLEISQYE